jgi:hypothetical protein
MAHQDSIDLQAAIPKAKGRSSLSYCYFISFPHQDLTMDTDLTAANGKKLKALEIFSYALQYFKEQALKVGPRVSASQPV